MKARFRSFLRTMHSDTEAKADCGRMFVIVSAMLLVCDLGFLVIRALTPASEPLAAIRITIQQANCTYGVLLVLAVGFQLLVLKVCKTEGEKAGQTEEKEKET